MAEIADSGLVRFRGDLVEKGLTLEVFGEADEMRESGRMIFQDRESSLNPSRHFAARHRLLGDRPSLTL